MKVEKSAKGAKLLSTKPRRDESVIAKDAKSAEDVDK